VTAVDNWLSAIPISQVKIMKNNWKLLAVLCLAIALPLSVLAQTAAAPATSAQTMLTPEEREAALKSLQATHDAFLQSIAGLSEKQWRFKPAPDRWSVAEVSEHITVTENMIFGMIQSKIMTGPATPEKRSEVKVTDDQILKMVPDRTHKFQAPEPLKPTNRWATEADQTKAFEEARQKTMDYVRTTNDDLRDHFGPHPVIGEMDAYQWILLISAHSERHTKQIEEVKADPNFPKD
jgi:hypothetical protein